MRNTAGNTNVSFTIRMLFSAAREILKILLMAWMPVVNLRMFGKMAFMLC